MLVGTHAVDNYDTAYQVALRAFVIEREIPGLDTIARHGIWPGD